MILPDGLLQIGQVRCVVLLAPLLQGFILKAEERVQRSQGPSIFQSYRDLWKLFYKQSDGHRGKTEREKGNSCGPAIMVRIPTGTFRILGVELKGS